MRRSASTLDEPQDRAHEVVNHPHGQGGSHHLKMEVEFRRRFWVSLVLSAPVLALGAPIPTWLTLRDRLAFPGDGLVQATFATVIYFYGGLPLLRASVASWEGASQA